MKDFTLTTYRNLLHAIQQSGYSFFTFEDWCDNKANGRYVILRHDVDLKADNSLTIAMIEAEMGIRSTYYFRCVPQSNVSHIITSIAALGHEIGYHYEDLSLFQGNKDKAIEHFKLQLGHFRQFYPVRTVCMHGSPNSKWDNRDLWKSYNYRDYGVIGEPYFDFLSNIGDLNSDVSYFTDTARMWDGEQYNFRDKILITKEQLLDKNSDVNDFKESSKIHSTFDLISWLEMVPSKKVIMITTHPQRWTDNSVYWLFELLTQSLKNPIKKLILKIA